jgi:ferredoxin
MMRINADREICIASGNCVMALPAVFDQDDDGLVRLIDPTPDPSLEDQVRSAVRRCPSGALGLQD